jgi:hypothetical protein
MSYIKGVKKGQGLLIGKEVNTHLHTQNAAQNNNEK